MTFGNRLPCLGILYLLLFSSCDGFALRLFRTTDMSHGKVAKEADGAGAMPRVTIADSQLFSGTRDIPIFAPAIVFATTTTTTAPTPRPLKGVFRPGPAGILSSGNKPCSSYEDCRRLLMRTLMLKLLLKDKDPLAAFRNVGKALGSTAMGSSIRGGSFRMFLPATNSTKFFVAPKFKSLNLPVIGGKMDMGKVFRDKTPILLHPRSIFTPWPEARHKGLESDSSH